MLSCWIDPTLRPPQTTAHQLPCPLPSPAVCSNSCSLSHWCHSTISSSVVSFSSCPQSFPASGSWSMSWLYASDGQSIDALASASGPSNEYSGLISFRMDWFDLAVQGTLKSLLQYHSLKASILQHSAFYMVQLSQLYKTTGKTIALTIYEPLSPKWSLWFLIIFLGLS